MGLIDGYDSLNYPITCFQNEQTNRRVVLANKCAVLTCKRAMQY